MTVQLQVQVAVFVFVCVCVGSDVRPRISYLSPFITPRSGAMSVSSFLSLRGPSHPHLSYPPVLSVSPRFDLLLLAQG